MPIFLIYCIVVNTQLYVVNTQLYVVNTQLYVVKYATVCSKYVTAGNGLRQSGGVARRRTSGTGRRPPPTSSAGRRQRTRQWAYLSIFLSVLSEYVFRNFNFTDITFKKKLVSQLKIKRYHISK